MYNIGSVREDRRKEQGRSDLRFRRLAAVELGESSNATIAIDAALAPLVEAALRKEGLVLQQAGPARGATDAALLITVLVPSIVTLALLVEKLRRLRLPRTYIYPRLDGGADIHVDEAVRDGRIVIVRPDGVVEELVDKEIGAAALQEALGPSRSPDA